MAGNARDELLTTFKSLLESGLYSDLVITCQGDTYKVHKAVVCARSDFFERAERFPVGKESEEAKIDLPKDDPYYVKLLIQYMYEGEYDPKLPDNDCMEVAGEVHFTERRSNGYHYKFPHNCNRITHGGNCAIPLVCPHHRCDGNPCYPGKCVDFICESCCPDARRTLPPAKGTATQLLRHAKMYEIGDKYGVIGLKELAREKFLRATAKYWNDEQFAPAAYYAFNTTPEEDKGLRDVVSNTISAHMELLNKPAVETLLTEFNGLAVGLLKMRAKDLGWIKKA